MRVLATGASGFVGSYLRTLATLLDAAKHVRGFGFPLTRDAAEYMLTLVPSGRLGPVPASWPVRPERSS
jgi:nucleoside-diphosphate-sugar epimerase